MALYRGIRSDIGHYRTLLAPNPMLRRITCISYACRDPIDCQEDGVGQFVALALLVAGVLPLLFIQHQGTAEGAQAAQERDLEVAQRIDVGIAPLNRLL